MRRMVVFVVLAALAAVLLLILRERRRAFIAAQVQLLQSDDRQEAEAARKRLQRVGRSAVRPVCALLEHEDEQVRARAALTVANIGHAAACGPLMQAAKRGDFPAADALELVKHPRAKEARAWVWCRLAERNAEGLLRRLPVGGERPTVPCIAWDAPYAPFRQPQRRRWQQHWPESLYGCHGPGARYSYKPRSIDRLYWEALEKWPLSPEPLIGRARLHALCCDYEAATKLYSEALARVPNSEVAQKGQRDAKRPAALAREMKALLPSAHRVQQILTHSTWEHDGAAHYIGVATWAPADLSLFTAAPQFVIFKRSTNGLERLGVVSPFDETEMKWPRRAAVYAAVEDLHGDGAATLVVLRAFGVAKRGARYGETTYDVVLYRFQKATLVKTLQVPSIAMPWVGDLDDDGDAEILTWRNSRMDPVPWYRLPWPIVRTLVDGRYQIRTESFPSVFEDILPFLERYEGASRWAGDPKISDHLGQAYEIVGKRALAVAAYERAEEKYLDQAEQMSCLFRDDDARLHRQRAEAVKERRLRLEAKLTASPDA